MFHQHIDRTERDISDWEEEEEFSFVIRSLSFSHRRIPNVDTYARVDSLSSSIVKKEEEEERPIDRKDSNITVLLLPFRKKLFFFLFFLRISVRRRRCICLGMMISEMYNRR